MILRTLVALCTILIGCSAGVPATTSPSGALVSAPASPAPSPDPTGSPAPSPSAGSVARICAEPEGAAINLPWVVRRYVAAWSEHDAAARLRLLEEIWADDGRYVESPGPAQAPVLGRAAMSDLIAQNQGSRGDWFEPRAWHEGYAHHDLLVMPWRHCTADGQSGVIGTDYAELDADGRIGLAVGFSPLTPDGSGIGEQPAAVCAGDDSFDWSAVPPIVERYAAAWNAAASAEREEILNAIADQETQFAASWDPSTPVGPAEITEFIDQWKTPGNYVELSAWDDGDYHDGWFHVRWRDCSSTGEGFVEGIEVLHVDGDGMLGRAVSFASW